MRSHLKVYFNFEEDTNALNDTEKGRLLLAMLRYAKTCTESNLTGNERFLFPVFKAQIDRDIETYEVKVSNGSKGGRPKNENEPNESKENLKKHNETETNLNAKIEDRIQKKEDIKDISLTGDKEKPRSRFTPPTVEEVREYCKERGNNVNPERFVDYYQSQKWKKSNGQPLVDWKAGVRTWEERDKSSGKSAGNVRPINPAQNYQQREYSEKPDTLEDLMKRCGAL